MKEIEVVDVASIIIPEFHIAAEDIDVINIITGIRCQVTGEDNM